jgi:hydroxyacylglutathione hydrolase
MITVQQFTFNPVQENTYLLCHQNGKAILIDPGCYYVAEQDLLKKFINDNNLTITQLVNTHCHLDHVFGNKWAAETFNLELYIHPLEEKLLEYAPTSGLQWGLSFENYNGKLNFLNEGDKLMLEDELIEILHTPGHSPGSISFYNKNHNVLISGDVLFKESIGRTDLPLGDYDTLIKSIQEKLFVLPDITRVYSGHGPQTTIGYEKMNNQFVKI